MAKRELHDGRTLKRANPKTIQDKFLVGYQGWFTCAGDGEPVGPGHHGWLHWFNAPIPSGGRPNTDLWPDVSEYSPSELFPAPGLKTADGDQLFLFSSRHPKTVQRHFHWMALHGVDGAFLQRFAGQCDIESGNKGIRNIRDEVGDRVREAAEAEGRVYAIMYDVSGVSPDRIQGVLERDWVHLLHDRGLLDSPNYLREKGRPVVALWGFGFNGRHHTPELVRSITDFFRSSTPGGAYIVAGVPGHWRTSTGDADRNPEFVRVWTECFDAISPWTVGRYGNEEEADRWGEVRVKADAEYLKKLEEEGGRKIDYIPVVLPGGSGYNLSEGKWGMNEIQRHGGRFLWRQIYNARRAGVRTIYGAMWDEYDEGTAFMPVVSTASQLPVHPSYKFVALDVDGYDLPSDWYMRIVGFAAEAFHGERTFVDTFPFKELQDYWGSRPHYEEIDDEEERKRQLEEVTRAFREWEASDGNAGALNDAPPPPYSLEASPPPPQTQPAPVQASMSRGQSSSGATSAGVLSPQHSRASPAALSGQGSLTATPGEIVLRPPMAAHSISAPSTSSSSSLPPPPPRHPSTSPAPPINPPSSSSSRLPPPPRHPNVSSAPSVDLSSHPRRSATPSTRAQRLPERAGAGVAMAPPMLQHRRSSSRSPPRMPTASFSHAAHDIGRHPSHPGIHAPSPTTYPAALQAGHVPSMRHSPNPAMGMPSAVAFPAAVEVVQRGRERSRERHRRSSSSGSRKKGKSPKRQKSPQRQKLLKRQRSPRRSDVHHRPSTTSHSSANSPSPHSMALHQAHSDAWAGAGGTVIHGPYTPGHPHQHVHTQLGHTPSGGSSYTMPQHQGTYPTHYHNQTAYGGPSYGQGYGYDPPRPHTLSHSASHAQLSSGHGHSPHPHAPHSPHSPPPMMSHGGGPSNPHLYPHTSSHSSYYPPYPPGPGMHYAADGASGSAGGVGVGGVGGSGVGGAIMNSLSGAFIAVEGIAGKETRRQLEQKVKNLTNKFK